MTYEKETAAFNPFVATDKAGNIGTGQRKGQNDNGQKSLLKPLRTVSMPELYDTVSGHRSAESLYRQTKRLPNGCPSYAQAAGGGAV